MIELADGKAYAKSSEKYREKAQRVLLKSDTFSLRKAQFLANFPGFIEMSKIVSRPLLSMEIYLSPPYIKLVHLSRACCL
jgi:hypothetical protein